MSKKLSFLSVTLFIIGSVILSAKEYDVKITPEISYVKVKDTGKTIKVKRIQNTLFQLTDDYTKTSRECPPFCIQPTKVSEGINNIEELEILTFMQHEVKNGTGVIVDARLPNWYGVETIPSAINIPFNLLQTASKEHVETILKLLGMHINSDGSYDYSKAKILAVFCNGVWCEQSKAFMDAIEKYQYPKEKLLYYRSGFQGWKLLGLTTTVHK